MFDKIRRALDSLRSERQSPVVPRMLTLGCSLATMLLVSLTYLSVTVAQTSIDFAVIGRYGAVSRRNAGVSAMVKSWDPDFIVTIGDNNYRFGEAATIDPNIGQYYSDYIGNYQGSYGLGSPTNRFFPALGNHDAANVAGIQPYLDYFTLPGDGISGNSSGNERYYNFVQGDIEIFVVHNANPGHEPDGISADSVQGQWLQNALAASTAKWQFVVAHKQPWSDPTLDWPFAAWGADAVFSESAGFERHMFHGIPYFGNGAGGNTPPFSGHGAQRVTVEDGSATFEFYEYENPAEPVDTLTIASPILLGDVNQDGAINFLDISTFIGILTMNEFLDNADLNRDGMVNFLDISPFIRLLSTQ